MIRAIRGLRAARCVRLVPLLALSMSLAAGVPAAHAQVVPNLWSIQLHGGLFTPIEAGGASSTVGMRYCKHYTPYLQAGLLTGLTMKSKRLESPSDSALSGGTSVELARFDARLVPIMGFMQVNLTEKLWLVPFVGIGAGYEWLSLHSQDNRTGLESSAIYGNVAWETYGGLGLRLTPKVRVNGELFYNGGSLERRVPSSSGLELREAVHVSGVGMRVGLDMIFD